MTKLIPVLMAGLLALAAFNVYNHNQIRQRDQRAQVERTRTFCQTELHTRQLMARAFSTAFTDDVGGENPDSAVENARERRLADRLETDLHTLPTGCDDFVDASTIRIQVE